MADKNKTPAESAKFHFQFALMMFNVGRVEESDAAFQKGFAALEEVIKAES